MDTVSLKKPSAFGSTINREWLVHFFIWIFLTASFAFSGNRSQLFPDNGIVFITLTLIIPFYINANLLIPRYFKKSKWIKFILLLAVLLLAINILKALFLILSMELNGMEYDFNAEFSKWVFRDFRTLEKFVFGSTAMLVYLSFAYRITRDWIINERVKDRLISEKATMELALLKSQVNPHFLFNSLNNIYAMALEEKAERTADGVAKMGTLMRYSLHDAQADFISLRKELDYIERYIEMQKLRITEDGKLAINFSFSGPGTGDEKIAPMILIPFIENAFKYGISTVKESAIDIKLSLSGSVLSLHVLNNIHSDIRAENGGLGLKNAQNRLQLIYPDRHKLVYGLRDNRKYIVDLEINLKK